jgi:tetratricopeptide (TPR) repeat protein
VTNVVLLYLFLAGVTGARWRSLLVAALFAIHPINVESVAWVSERKNVLSMFFFLLTLIAYAWYARRPNIVRFAAALAGFALGLAAKPQIVTLPFVLLLLDYWPLQRFAKWQSPSSNFHAPQYNAGMLLAEKIPFFLFAFASSIITMLAQQGAIYSTAALPFWPRFTNAVFAYFEYLWKTIWPLHLAAFYPHWGRLISWWQVALAAAFLIAVSVHVWRRRAHGYWITGWLWFLGTLVPMIGLVQAGQQGMADRYGYLPLIGIFILSVWAIADLGENLHLKPKGAIAISAAVLIALLVLTVRQVATWASSYDLWAHALKVTDSNYVAEDFIGAAILLDQYKATGQRYSDEAAAHFRNAVRFDPDDTLGRLNLGADYHERGQLQEAIAQYQIAYRTAQSYDLLKKACTDLAAVYELLGDFESARQYYRQALQITPGDPILLTNLGRLRMSQRVSELAKSAEEHPSADTYWQLGRLQRDLGQLSNAKSSFEHALKLAPTFAEARQALNDISQASTHQD